MYILQRETTTVLQNDVIRWNSMHLLSLNVFAGQKLHILHFFGWIQNCLSLFGLLKEMANSDI